MEKRELNDEELKNVNGACDGAVMCPHCDMLQPSASYNPQTIGEGCDAETYFTCPSCGTVFTR